MKKFYSGLKEVWGPQTKQPVHLKSSDGVETFTVSKSLMAWGQRARRNGKHTIAQCQYCSG